MSAPKIVERRSANGSTAPRRWSGTARSAPSRSTPFDHATVAAAKHAAERTKAGKLVSVAGGGDTVAALNHAGVADDFTYVSTAGGAFLEWMEGKPLPGVEVLEQSRAAPRRESTTRRTAPTGTFNRFNFRCHSL